MKKLLCFLCMSLLCACGSQNNDAVKSGLAYYTAHGSDAICVASVYMKGDVIESAQIDELTYLSSEEYDALISSVLTEDNKQIASKVDNNQMYSQAMQIAGSTNSIKENFQAICEFVKGKTVEEIEKELNRHTQDEMVDLVTGCTLQSTSGYLQAILEACRQAQ